MEGTMIRLKDYAPIVGEKTLEQIRDEASALYGKQVVHINSTYYGGGVAEMLNSLVPLFNEMGIETGWRVLKGKPDFFTITKKFHNALQGDAINLSHMKKRIYQKVNQVNATFSHIKHHDCIIVHDPQPLPIIQYYRKTQPWLWRCHIDLSHPNRELWNYLSQFINRYDKVIVSKKTFMQDLDIPQEVIYPSIDPLSPKNEELRDAVIDKYLSKFGIEQDKPIVSQISRFDKWKDPVGVIRAFKQVRKRVDCRLVLL
ncbi:glycosyl transferase family 1, partial [Candidatus Woesearchaeota archaeon CG_4_10_14_0_8_um_filter_47_5]